MNEEVNILDNSNNTSSYQILGDETDQDQSIKPSYILSVISWIIFTCTLLEYIINKPLVIDHKYRVIIAIPYFPLIELFIFVNSLLGLISYLIFTTYKKNDNLYNAMLSGVVKTHSAPLFLLSLMLITEKLIINCIHSRYFEVGFEVALIIFHFLLCIASLVFIFIIVLKISKMQYSLKWYMVLPIKKGAFSCLLPYLLYKFSYDLCVLFAFMEAKISFIDFVFIVLFISIGAISLFFSFILKDIIMAVTNILISIGLLVNINLYEIFRYFLTDSGLVISIIVGIISVLASAIIIFLLLKKSEDVFK